MLFDNSAATTIRLAVVAELCSGCLVFRQTESPEAKEEVECLLI